MSNLIEKLRMALTPSAVLEGPEAAEKARSIWTRLGTPHAVLLPTTTMEVSSILRLCNEAHQPVVPWGGKTSMVDGALADNAVALSLERMNRIEEIDAVGRTLTAQAGCVLQSVCEAAAAKGFLFPLDLGARGSATIGGNISTNAGGNRVIRYGMTRDMVLGLEAVLADGTVLSSMNHMIKNNAGYDLKQLFIGSEGTLGVVTRAVLRLRPKPVSQDTALVAIDSFDRLPGFLRQMERGLGGTLSAYEVMWADFYNLVTSAPAKGWPLIPLGHPYYVLLEAMGGDQAEDSARFERVLMAALQAGEIADAVLAKSQAEREQMWSLRDDVSQLSRNAPIFTFDIGLRISEMDGYIAEIRAALSTKWPRMTLVVFGHLGDGNLHVIVGVGDGSREARHAVEQIVYTALRSRGGTVSAEHGIGLEKRSYLGWSRTPEEVALMHSLKHALDPRGILNPGKIFPAAEA